MNYLFQRKNRHRLRKAGAGLAAFCALIGSASAHPHQHGDDSHNHTSGWVHENGIGPDPDKDTNPATITGPEALLGDAAAAADDPSFAVITFEAPPGGHGDVIINAYKKEFGVSFLPKITRQICKGQRHFQYNSMCTYEAAPSGRYAAGYRNFSHRPLTVAFEEPVCAVALAVYPTGGKDAEEFTLTIEAWDEDDSPLPGKEAKFEWTSNTVRWLNMSGAYYLDRKAKKIEISLKGKEERDVMRFLIDDFAFVTDGCRETLDDIAGDEDAANGADLDDETVISTAPAEVG